MAAKLTFDINDISDLVGFEIRGQMFYSLFLVAPREHVSGATAVSCGVDHLGAFLLSVRQDNLSYYTPSLHYIYLYMKLYLSSQSLV